MSRSQWTLIPLAVVSASSHATEYFTVEQVQQVIFPSGKLAPIAVSLTDEQVQHIEKISGVKVAHKEVKAWKVANGGWLIIDEVMGKHEYITYAVGLNANGSIKQIEIMNYKESYGYGVRQIAWRKQFVGKTSTSPIKLNQDIINISGATLSCQHVTEGIKRVLATYAVALK
ncbi:MAG: hypothetical protein NVS3B3_17650 [Aquirhabdus sp.]